MVKQLQKSRPPRKLVQKISGLGGISDSGLARVLKVCRDCPELLDHELSARYISKCANALASDVCTTVSMDNRKGEPFEWTYASPQKLLAFLCRSHASLWKTLKKLHGVRPSSKQRPWRIVLYADELTPGAQLTPQNYRKSWSFLMTFMEFGPLIGKDAAWLPLGLLRTSICKTIPAGVSCAMKHVIRGMVLGPRSMTEAGLPLSNGSESFVLFARVNKTLGDEAALTRMWSGKSASGLLRCLKCSNAWDPTKCDPPRVDTSGYFVPIDCDNFSRFLPTTDEEHWEKMTCCEMLFMLARLVNSDSLKLIVAGLLSRTV